MPTRAPARPPVRSPARSLACAVAALALVTGCGDESSKQAQTPPTVTHATDSSGPAASSTAPPTAATPPSTSTPARSPGPLLSAAELPGFNDEFTWAQGPATTTGPATSFGTCQRFGILSIGAERVVVRRFTPADAAATNDRAGELVANFPDPMTAKRAYSVLTAWRAKCADRLLDHVRRDVGPLQPVRVEGGRAGWYLLTYGPVPGRTDEQFFDAQGMALVGSRIAMVSMVLAGQDYDYDAGREPMVVALQRAALKLG